MSGGSERYHRLRTGAKLSVPIPAVIFVVGLLPLASWFLVHHPDERHYTDAAIAMVHSGDYWTPRSADGSPRFVKPVVVYWLVALSFKLLGMSAFASRLPFLLAGAAILILTRRLARILNQSDATSELSVAILMAHPLLILGACRSLPDIYLCLFVLVSATGFFDCLVAPQRSRLAAPMFYVGAGLAVASKGLIGLVFPVYCVLFAVARCDRLSALRSLLHGPAMAIGGLIATAWYCAMIGLHGPMALAVFWGDQVSDKVANHWTLPIAQLPFLLVLTIIGFLPWSAAALSALLHRRQAMHNGQASKANSVGAFAVGWLILLAAIFSCSDYISERYLLPASPFLAIWHAQTIHGESSAAVDRWARQLLIVCLSAFAILGFSWCAVLFISCVAAEATVAILSLCTLLALLLTGLMRPATLRPTLALACAIFSIIPMFFVLSAPLRTADQGWQIICALRSANLANQEIDLVGKDALAAKMRLVSGGQMKVNRVHFVQEAIRDGAAVIVCSRDDAAGVSGDACRILPASVGFRDISVSRLLYSIAIGKWNAYLDSRREEYVIIVLPPSSHAAAIGG